MELAATAAAQHAVFTRDEALAAGFSRHAIATRLASGLWIAEHPAVYRLAGAPVTFDQSIMAACLAAGDDAVASHRAAAALWGLGTIKPVVEVTIPPSRRRRLDGVRVHRSEISRLDRTHLGPIPVTTPARTLIDEVALVSIREAENVLEDALTRRLLTTRYLWRRLDALETRGRAGIRVLHELLLARPDAWTRAESRLERRILRVLDDFGLPKPTLQYKIKLPSGRTVRRDIVYPPQRVIVEGDGYAFHVRRRDWVRNRTANRQLEAMGWRIIPATWEDVTETPHVLAELVRMALAVDLWNPGPALPA